MYVFKPSFSPSPSRVLPYLQKQILKRHFSSSPRMHDPISHMADTKDFSVNTKMSSPTRVNFDIEAARTSGTAGSQGPLYRSPSIQSDRINSPTSPSSIKRRRTRTMTSRSKTFSTVNIAEAKPGWHPGQEPGLDPQRENGGRPSTPDLHEECQITVVDFSEGSTLR